MEPNASATSSDRLSTDSIPPGAASNAMPLIREDAFGRVQSTFAMSRSWRHDRSGEFAAELTREGPLARRCRTDHDARNRPVEPSRAHHSARRHLHRRTAMAHIANAEQARPGTKPRPRRPLYPG